MQLALDEPELSPRELAVRFTDSESYFVSEASVYRLLKAHDLITSPAFIVVKAADKFAQEHGAEPAVADGLHLSARHRLGLVLSITILDDYSRYILAWKLCATMAASDVTETLEMALAVSGLDSVRVCHRLRLLSDNGPSYVAKDLAEWLQERGMTHTRGKPYHPMTQGKIERWHRSMKNEVLLENYYLPGDLERRIADFVAYYNTKRPHESLNNLTPADVYAGRGIAILDQRRRIKLKTLEQDAACIDKPSQHNR